MASSEAADIQLMTENERLISTLQACFSELLVQQKEQTERLIAEIKPKSLSTTDKKAVFWNAYKTLADEQDKEFLQRYGTDLDTSLIFAGLFSAVDSAFIIQIQPELEVPMPPLITLVAQSLLYFSLGATLLAALLAVLGKQWLTYYSAAGEHGTVEMRGLERQRKLDGLRRWKFDMIMQMFPLLLQFALFLFAAALCVYLWRIHEVLALIVLGMTTFGTVSYILLLASAIVFQDSPFQTPLAPFVAHLFPKWVSFISRDILKWMIKLYQSLAAAAYSMHIQRSQDLPPFPRLEKATPLFATTAGPSPEIPAVCWVLETSTDPDMVTQAAGMVVDLQWPSTTNVQPQLARLQEHMVACFNSHQRSDDMTALHDMRQGMDNRAIQLGHAYHILYFVNGTPGQKHMIFSGDLKELHPEVHNIMYLLGSRCSFILDKTVDVKWWLNVLPKHYCALQYETRYLEHFLTAMTRGTCSLDCSEFSDYLFCIYAFLLKDKASVEDIMWTGDKSPFQQQIFQEILNTIISSNVAANSDSVG
ncbi:hypothetical protein K438DRAFT_1811134 [Mycena galopus ATCC 62051]|nr:hypothetical protein K438DRAFT_1811134 [Mycena galopus ATCC 62051]